MPFSFPLSLSFTINHSSKSITGITVQKGYIQVYAFTLSRDYQV